MIQSGLDLRTRWLFPLPLGSGYQGVIGGRVECGGATFCNFSSIEVISHSRLEPEGCNPICHTCSNSLLLSMVVRLGLPITAPLLIYISL